MAPDLALEENTLPIGVEMSSRRGAALVVALGGLAVLVGSFGKWDIEGGSSFYEWSRSGIEIGPGVLTAELGLLLLATGSVAFRRRGMSPFRIEAMALALLTLLAVGAYIVRTYLIPEFDTYGPRLAVYLVAGGAAVAAVGSARLNPPDRAGRAWALARRLPLAFLITGMAVWGLAVHGHLALSIEPLTYAVVLMSLGVGLWPGPLVVSGVTPPTVGMVILLYGALSLIAILFGGFPAELLVGMPIALLAVVAIVAVPEVLDLPAETPYPRPVPDRIDVFLAATRTVSGLMVAALLLTGATVVLLVLRLLAPGRRFLGLTLVDGGPTDHAWLVWLLAAGLAIGGGITIAIRRRSE